MRDIKFRAWDKLSKQMIGCYMAGLNMDFTNGQIYSGGINVTDKLELMQYTGLNDCNGEAIFEGDICTFIGKKYTVVNECGSFGLASNECIDYDPIRESMDKFLGNTFSGCFNDNFISLWEVYWNFFGEEGCISEIEVIGNYKNPALLRGV